MRHPKPNSVDPFNGKRPGEMMYAYAKSRHICPHCTTRWADENHILCDPCAAQYAARAQMRKRRKLSKDKHPTRPMWVEVVLAPETRSKDDFMVVINSDIGTIAQLRFVQSVDIRDARQGKAKLLAFRKARAA